MSRLLLLEPRDARRYVEPFAGSACLFFAIRPTSAILADVNSELIDAYEVIRRHPRLVARAVIALPPTEREYYRVRRHIPSELNDVDRAARFVYLNRYCFNGVYRINRKGEFNVPRGKRTGSVPSEAAIYRCSVALRSARLMCADFEDTVSRAGAGDFVYLDPPYASTTRKTHGEYGYDTFAQCDLSRLVRCLRRLDRSGATFLLSYADNKMVRQQTSRWYQRTLCVQRHVAGFARHRRRVREILVSNRPLDCESSE